MAPAEEPQELLSAQEGSGPRSQRVQAVQQELLYAETQVRDPGTCPREERPNGPLWSSINTGSFSGSWDGCIVITHVNVHNLHSGILTSSDDFQNHLFYSLFEQSNTILHLGYG